MSVTTHKKVLPRVDLEGNVMNERHDRPNLNIKAPPNVIQIDGIDISPIPFWVTVVIVMSFYAAYTALLIISKLKGEITWRLLIQHAI